MVFGQDLHFFLPFSFLCAKIPRAAFTFSFFQKSKEKKFYSPKRALESFTYFAFYFYPSERMLFRYDCMTV